MADDRMKKDEQQRNMGAGREDQGFGQQSPGRTGQGGQSGETGGQQAGQHGQQGQQGQPGQFGGQKGAPNKEDDDDFATGGQGMGQGRGGQNR